MSKDKALLTPIQRAVYVTLLDLDGEASSKNIADSISYVHYFMEGVVLDGLSVRSVANTLCFLRDKGFVRGPMHGKWYVPYRYNLKYGWGG